MNIITLDIETFADTARVWGGGMYEQNLIKKVTYGGLASFAYKKLGSSKVFCVTREGQSSDRKLLIALRNVLDSADVVIAQNGKKFDVREINKRFLKHGIRFPSPYKIIDTMTEMKRIARLDSYSLDNMSQFLGLGAKLKHRGFEMWELCEQDDPRAWREMVKYNKHDVVLTEKLYLAIQANIKSHPVITERPHACTKCGHDRLQARGVRNGLARFMCRACWGWSTARVLKSGDMGKLKSA
jgi:DNA polymerase elongation subunit (family B)